MKSVFIFFENGTQFSASTEKSDVEYFALKGKDMGLVYTAEANSLINPVKEETDDSCFYLSMT